jgi:hypothetical protein
VARCIKALKTSFQISSKEQQQLGSFWKLREEATAHAKTNTIFGYSMALDCNRNAEGLHGLVERLGKRALEAIEESAKPLHKIVDSRRTELGLRKTLEGYRLWILIIGYIPWMIFWLCAMPTKIPQFLCGSVAVVGWAVIVYAGLPVACTLLEALWFVPGLIINTIWEQTIGTPARRRLKELESLKEELEGVFA